MSDTPLIDELSELLDTLQSPQFEEFVSTTIYPRVEDLAENIHFGETTGLDEVHLADELRNSLPVVESLLDITHLIPTSGLNEAEAWALQVLIHFAHDAVPLFHIYLLGVLRLFLKESQEMTANTEVGPS